jgi:uncharacterized repeat protein (TIGR02543 family)
LQGANSGKAEIKSGQSTGTVTITGKTVSADTAVTVRATSPADSTRYKDATLTVKPHTFKITYNKNDSSATGAVADQTNLTYGGTVKASSTAFVKTGYTHNWNTQSNGSGTAITLGGDVPLANQTTTPNGTTTLYAKWTATTYSITYHLENGTQAVGAVTTYTAETPTFSLPTPTKTDNTFSGWYNNSAFTGSAVTQIVQGATGNKEFWARWMPASGQTTPVTGKEDNPDLMIKFGVKSEGYAISSISLQNVIDTFTDVSTYIKTQDPASVNPSNGLGGVIKMGDYINLRSLSVAEYNGNGGAIDLTNSDAGDDRLRVIVVAINSYYNTSGNGSTTPHLVFRFKEPPGRARLLDSNTLSMGFTYCGTEMHTKYLKENYWTGLKNAGVPEEAVFKVRRIFPLRYSDTQIVGQFNTDITLWLPTISEMWGQSGLTYSEESSGSYSNGTSFPYYTSNQENRETWSGPLFVWTASRYPGANLFVVCWQSGDFTTSDPTETTGGVAPAFVIK